MFSASSEARDRNAPTNANQIRLQTSRIRQEHRPIRYQLSARLSFRQGHLDPRALLLILPTWVYEIIERTMTDSHATVSDSATKGILNFRPNTRGCTLRV